MAPPRLRAELLSKVFAASGPGGDPVEALDEVEIEVGAGEFVSVVGPSGCGKSTLLNLLAGLEAPSGGRILLDGREGELLGNVGHMPQADLLMPWRSVLDNAALAPRLRGLGRARARDLARAHFERFGLAGFEDAWPADVSTGMRQRAALLRTFLAGPEVLLLDEPFAALDALTRREMQAWLLGVWESSAMTIVLVTHDVEEALFLSDRVYVMSGRPGRIELGLEVMLGRPRDPERTPLEPAFLELKRALLEPLLRSAPAGGER